MNMHRILLLFSNEQQQKLQYTKSLLCHTLHLYAEQKRPIEHCM